MDGGGERGENGERGGGQNGANREQERLPPPPALHTHHGADLGLLHGELEDALHKELRVLGGDAGELALLVGGEGLGVEGVRVEGGEEREVVDEVVVLHGERAGTRAGSGSGQELGA